MSQIYGSIHSKQWTEPFSSNSYCSIWSVCVVKLAVTTSKWPILLPFSWLVFEWRLCEHVVHAYSCPLFKECCIDDFAGVFPRKCTTAHGIVDFWFAMRRNNTHNLLCLWLAHPDIQKKAMSPKQTSPRHIYVIVMLFNQCLGMPKSERNKPFVCVEILDLWL